MTDGLRISTTTVADTPAVTTPRTTATQPKTATTTQAPASPQDTNKTRSIATSGTAVASLSFTSPPPVDLRNLLPGFKSGSKFDVDATGVKSWVVGGEGSIGTLSATALKMKIHVTAPGVDERMNVDLRAENGGYHLVSPENWKVSIEKKGDWYRMTNLDNPKQYIELKSTGQGHAQIRTKGMEGVDGTTLTLDV